MKKTLTQRYFEAIGNQAASLSLSSLPTFYKNYVNDNIEKVRSELERVGYFTLKNKLSIGNSSNTTKDVFISTYFINMDEVDKCNRMIAQKYHGDSDVRTTGGFFIPSTNEVVVFVRVDDVDKIDKALKKSDIRSTIEHELVHAFDHTNKSDRLSKQNYVPGVGENFLSACAYLGCADRNVIADIIGRDLFSGGAVSACLYSISLLLYKLFTLTEFNAHQMSDLEKTHNVDIKKSDDVRKALKRDVLNDLNLTKDHLKRAVMLDAEDNPEMWTMVGKVLNYLGYNVNAESPSAVYRFFKRTSEKLFNKYLDKKTKNQAKSIISLREKQGIKEKLASCIKNGDTEKGVSFWFSPTGNRDSFLCRVNAPSGNVNILVNKKPIPVIGNADNIFKRADDAASNKDKTKLDFALDNLVDIVVQSIERKFNDVKYDPIYDITTPQDEDQISKSNKIANRFADLDWD